MNTARGHERIAHMARRGLAAGKVLYRLDSRNAFNIAPRHKILDIVKRLGEKDPHLLQYFVTMYQPVSSLFVYGENRSVACVQASEGVRQGDALSSFYFCLLMDAYCTELSAEFREQNVDVWAYMDDCTIAAPPSVTEAVLSKAMELMPKHGFEVNVQKSAMTCRSPLPDHRPVVPFRPPTEEFVTLGVNLTENYDAFNRRICNKVDAFSRWSITSTCTRKQSTRSCTSAATRNCYSTPPRRPHNTAGAYCHTSLGEQRFLSRSSSTSTLQTSNPEHYIDAAERPYPTTSRTRSDCTTHLS